MGDRNRTISSGYKRLSDLEDAVFTQCYDYSDP